MTVRSPEGSRKDSVNRDHLSHNQLPRVLPYDFFVVDERGSASGVEERTGKAFRA